MRLFGIGVLGLLMACGEEGEKTEDLSMYCGESETNNLIADDGDCDGILTADDCDDNDDTSTTIAEDADCDGTLTDDDCDDSDAESAIRSEDGDCDGVLTADDCNDLDPSSTIVADDGDCDGVLTADDCDDSDASDAALSGDCDADGYGQAVDCDDNDASSTIVANDGDCDGVLTADDCDDADAGSFTRAEDGDCDGALTDDDCDDSDAGSLTRADDGDCDGVLTADDCNDLDPSSTIVIDDGDCDGVLTADDCDDSDASDAALSGDCDADGYGQSVDCDDNDASSTTVAVDMDCDGALDINECDAGAGVDTDTDGDCDDDGILGINDCDDNDATLLASALDQDCDGVQTTYDCDDNDATDAGLSGDCDQDGIPALLDCDDTDGNLLAVATDADCDGALDVNECDAGAGVDTDTDGDCDDDGVLAGDDCDDNDATLLAIVDDADCDGVLDATCGGFLESVQDTALCYTDGDGDDFGSMLTSAGGLSPECYFIEISGETSSYSSIDSIVGYEDGVWEFYIDHDNYDSTPDFVAEGLSTTYCPSPTASLVELEFVDGSGFADYSVYYDDGMSTQLITTGSDSNGSHSILSESWPTVNTMPVYGTDCDDTDPNTHPGAAELDSTTACLTDADGDGYGLEVIQACYELTLSDSNYLGWDGNSISVLEDGLVTETFTISGSETTVTHEYCADSATQQVEFVFNEASSHNYGWFGGTGLSVSYVTDSGTVLAGSGSGVTSSAYTLLFDGNSFGSGDVFLSNTAPFAYGLSNGGTDCDDSNATVGSNVNDFDCDGVPTSSDCDDTDPYTYPGAAYNELDVTGDNVTDCTRDVDGDGYASSEPEHCLTFTMNAYDVNASDGHGIAVLVDGFFEELISFDENVSEETVCVSGTELDFVVMPYGNDLGNTFAGVSGSIEDAAGTISESFSASINSVASLTFDGTTYAAGDTFYSVTPVLPYELGSDCDDQSAVTYPGAAYNETGTSANECLTDTDGDGYGAEDLMACYELQMQNTSNTVSAWPTGLYIEVLVDTGLGTYNQSTFRMGSSDGASKTEEFCLPEWTDILFRYQHNHTTGANLSNVYAEIVGTTGTTEATLDGTHNGSSLFQTMRVYDSNGSFSTINSGSTILWSNSYPASTNVGGTDSNDNSAGVH